MKEKELDKIINLIPKATIRQVDVIMGQLHVQKEFLDMKYQGEEGRPSSRGPLENDEFITKKGWQTDEEDCWKEYDAAVSVNYEDNEERMNIIGQNGNDGLHYK